MVAKNSRRLSRPFRKSSAVALANGCSERPVSMWFDMGYSLRSARAALLLWFSRLA
jgi:hypothetical protein